MPSTDEHDAAGLDTIGASAVSELDDPWLTIGEAARYMHLSQSSLRRYDSWQNGKPPVLPATRTPGKQRRYRRSQLDAWLDRSDTAA